MLASDYVRQVADLLGLQDWRIDVVTAEIRSYAQVSLTTGRKVAVLELGGKFFAASQFSQRQTILHELIHIHLNRLLEPLESARPMLGSLCYRPLMDGVVSRLEEGVDGMAVAIAEHFPLPGSRLIGCASESKGATGAQTV